VQLRGAPYTVEIRAQTPHGFQVAFRLTKESSADLAQATDALVSWLAGSGYGVTMPHTDPDGLPF
jgi:hypothetical protein